MRVTLLGTGFAVPSPSRVQSGVLVETGENLILFDCGAGVLHRLAQSGFDSRDVTHVFLTHHHLDHCSDFMALLKANWLEGRGGMRLYGPEGTREWLASSIETYPYMKGRTEVGVTELGDRDRVELGMDAVEAGRNKHAIDGLAYRLTSSGRSLVYSGDTAPCEGIRRLCRGGVELLIHECSYPDREGSPYPDHTTPGGLGKLLEGLAVERVVLTHFSPEAEERLEDMKAALEMVYQGEVIVARDLMEAKL